MHLSYLSYKHALLFHDVARGAARLLSGGRVAYDGGPVEHIGETAAGVMRATLAAMPPAAYTAPVPCDRGHVGAYLPGDPALCVTCYASQPVGAHAEIEALRACRPAPIITRAEAQRYRLPAYRTGAPCRRGHVGAWRYTSTASCIECLRARRHTPTASRAA